MADQHHTAEAHDQPERYGGDGLDFDRDRLTLRFENRTLERAFQVDLGSRLILQLRLGLLLAGGLWITAGLLLTLIYAVDPVTMALAVSVPIAIVLGGIAIMPRFQSWDAQQIVNGLINLSGGLSMIFISTRVAQVPEMLGTVLILNSIFAFSVVRIGFVVGLAAGLPVLIWLGALAWIGAYSEIGWFTVFLVASGLGAAAFGAYMLESSSRARFLQRQDLADQGQALAREKAKSDRLLHTMLPASIADRLRDEQQVIADAFADATVIFADLVGFTPIGSEMAPADLVTVLNRLFGRFDELAAHHGLEKIKTIGDGYMAVGGVPLPVEDHADRAVRFALDIHRITDELAVELGMPLRLRVGIHSGPLVAGVIGRDKLAYDLWGDTVNVASRMESQGLPGRVQISEVTAQRLTTSVGLEPRGTIEVRGRGPMRVLLVSEPEDSSADLPASPIAPAAYAAEAVEPARS
ncbi:MAG TPA: adenylate/guanylate cyclase domain-containing protein [Candidatus Limnocylindria bacterium]|nr:adenylate/guanylate cyclase domain-containing protein [Candidatus Limnocylindria bacterium]